jgi:hypothetical protein
MGELGRLQSMDGKRWFPSANASRMTLPRCEAEGCRGYTMLLPPDDGVEPRRCWAHQHHEALGYCLKQFFAPPSSPAIPRPFRLPLADLVLEAHHLDVLIPYLYRPGVRVDLQGAVVTADCRINQQIGGELLLTGATFEQA